jgi:capsular polysaccharide export protein
MPPAIEPDGESEPDQPKQVFLFLQGPASPFFAEMANLLEARGHTALRINLSFGDWLFWRRGGATNFRGRRPGWPSFIAEYLDSQGVTDIVLIGEHRFYHKVAISAARARGIRVFVTDFGYLRPDWVTFEQDGMSGDSRFPRDPDAILALARTAPPFDPSVKYRDSFLLQALWDIAYHSSITVMRWLYPGYRSHQVTHPFLVYLGTGVHLLKSRLLSPSVDRRVVALRNAGLPYWVFPLQLESDFQLREYSPYQNMKTPLEEVIRSFAANAPANGHLLVKLHPMDPLMRNWPRMVRRAAQRYGIGDRVHFLDGGMLALALERTRGVVTVNSTTGLWALRVGLPTITLGTAVFDVPGLTFQGPLDRFWLEGRPPDPVLLDAFIRALVQEAQVRGVLFGRPGLDLAIRGSAERMERAARLGSGPA